ncbi:hypothetical protein [Winogradskyella ludwigii]|uniref:hypothetical protein n=1 Tax=Winogradskyella ludwigii TaxID=2686076 RepID=UPI0015C7B7A5|nr:hypothetical protein [Winogradskyella ludwigii]
MLKQLRAFINPKNILPKTSNPESKSIRIGLLAILVFTVFNGAIRKWIFNAGAIGSVILLLQIFVPILFYYLVARSNLPKLKKAPVIWLLYLFYVCLTAINPMNKTVYHGIFGVLLHTGYFLLWLAYLQKNQWMELEKLVPMLLLILVIEFVLASFQYALPGTHILNIQAGGGANNAIVGDAVRVSGTFSYIGGFQVMIPLFACLAWFMMLRHYATWLIFGVLGLGLLMAFMSGSRGAVGFFLMYVVIAIFLSGNTINSLFKLIIQGGLIITLVIFFAPSFQKSGINSYNNFKDRVENTDQVDDRVAGSYEQLLHFRGRYPIFGLGLGATYQGANALFGTSSYVKEFGGYESELERVVLEGGFVLLFLRIILVLVLLKNTEYLPFLGKAFFFVVFMNSMMTFNVYQGVFFVLGMLLVDRGYYLKQLELEQNDTELLNIM